MTELSKLAIAAQASYLAHGNTKKTHCKWGHEFTKANTRYTKTGARKCMACRRLQNMDNYNRYAEKRRQAARRRRKEKKCLNQKQ